MLRASNLDPTALASVSTKLEDILDDKNRAIQELQQELAKVTKAYNDMLMVTEAKLTENAIPTDDLPFKPYMPRAVLGHSAKGRKAPYGFRWGVCVDKPSVCV